MVLHDFKNCFYIFLKNELFTFAIEITRSFDWNLKKKKSYLFYFKCFSIVNKDFQL